MINTNPARAAADASSMRHLMDNGPPSPGLSPVRGSYNGSHSDVGGQHTPTLEQLFDSDSILDFDNEEPHGRYSVAPPPGSNSSAGSSIYTVDKTNRDSHATGHNSSRGSFLPVVMVEKGDWLDEADDALHNPGKLGPRVGRAGYIYETSAFRSGGGTGWAFAGVMNVLCLVCLVVGIIGVFAGRECLIFLPFSRLFYSLSAVYPITAHINDHNYVNTTSYIGPTSNTTTTNSTIAGTGGLINSNAPNISTRALIDPDTPTSAYTKTGIDNAALELVFSDEFNVDNRTFYTGEDPFWEMVDLRYWQTGDLEWYDPGQAHTENGYLALTLETSTKALSHQMGYLGGMLQSWNKFCFTGGRIELIRKKYAAYSGLWPSVWLMGNLGRAGYGGSLDGTWPYSYDSCDIGTLANQTDPTTGGPNATTTGLSSYNYALSYLPGQRLSRCTCPGENHPGPTYANGTFPGRSSPEIDLFETTASSSGGEASQSAQWAPMNPNYYIVNASTTNVEYNVESTTWDTKMNTYLGGAYQMSTSALSKTNATAYDSETDGPGTGEINWINQGEVMWRLSDTAMVANAAAEVGPRPIPGEPMSIIANLGLSTSFTTISADLTFPATMRIDYIRVPKGKTNIGCSPKLYPTADYIANNLAAYSNANLTTYAQFRSSVNETTTFPKNRLINTC
ncbi:hypothetical protein RQP46_010719 [Phenoliferia psychrophenolica]